MKAHLVFRKELQSYFGSFIAYILIAVFLLLSGYFFYTDLILFVLFGGFYLPSGLWQYFFLDVRFVMLLVLPLLTMRLFAEEKKLGTMELLWTYPVKDGEILAGKFLAVLVVFVLMLALTLLYPALLWRVYQFELGPVIGGYVGLFLLGVAFIACGTFISSLTENQVVSALGTYAVLVFFWFLTWNEEVAAERVVRFLLKLSLFDHFFNFSQGVIDSRDVTFFLLFSLLFVFLTLRSLEARKWRGIR